MHILYLHQYFVPPDGSGGTRSYELARRLVQVGHKVTMITSDAAFPDHYRLARHRTDVTIEGIDLIVLKVPYANRMSYSRRMGAFLKFALATFREIATCQDIDLVFATSTPLTIALPGFFAKIRHRCPMVFEVRDLWPELPVAVGALESRAAIWLAERLEKFAYHQSAHVIALSPGIAKGVSRTGYPAARITIVPNSCDMALFRVPAQAGADFLQNNPHLSGGPLVVYTGTMGRINGVVYLVEIAAEMRKLRPEVRFLISGWGKERPEIEQRAAREDVLGKNLWVVNSVPKAEMPSLLAAASLATSLFVDLPQMWNNSANKFFDALAAGRPVAINYQGWQADFLHETGAGLVLPPDDARISARLISEFLDDPARVERAQRAAREAGEIRFNRDRLAEKFIKTLENVVAES